MSDKAEVLYKRYNCLDTNEKFKCSNRDIGDGYGSSGCQFFYDGGCDHVPPDNDGFVYIPVDEFDGIRHTALPEGK